MKNEMNLIIGICIGIIGYGLLYLGKGIQKYAIEGIKEKQSIKDKNSGIWILGSLLTSTYLFIQWIALLYAPINMIAPLEGIGLIILLIFSYFALNEKITRIQGIGIVTIILGTFLITIFYNDAILTAQSFKLANFVLILILIFGGEFAALFLMYLKARNKIGLVLSFIAGSFMAYQTLCKRVTSIEDLSLTVVFSILAVLMGVLTFLFTQIAFAKEKANVVTPCFTATSIILASLIGVLTLNETINLLQVLGIISIIIGIILITAIKQEDIK